MKGSNLGLLFLAYLPRPQFCCREVQDRRSVSRRVFLARILREKCSKWKSVSLGGTWAL